MLRTHLPAFYLGVIEELQKQARCWEGYRPVPGKKPYSKDSCKPDTDKKKEKTAVELQTSVPGETSEGLLSRIRKDKVDFPKLLGNAKQHKWNVPGVPFANPLVQSYLNNNSPQAVKEKILKQDNKFLLDTINKNPGAFKGVYNPQPAMQSTIAKTAVDLSGMPINENILPNIKSQAKWKFVRTKEGLKLSDGNLVYSFGGFPEEFPTEDSKVSRLSDDNILDFDKDSVASGTAQIHRSSPDNIYLTLATGQDNPTFMLQHEGGKEWRYSPSKKFVEKLKRLGKDIKGTSQVKEEYSPVIEDTVLLDPKSLLEGAKEEIKAAELTLDWDRGDVADFLKGTFNRIGDIPSTLANHPVTTGLGAFLTLKGLKSGINHFVPTKRKEEPDLDVVPLAAGVGLPLALSAINRQGG